MPASVVAILVLLAGHVSRPAMQAASAGPQVFDTRPDSRRLFEGPVGVRCHPDGRVFVVDDQTHRVHVIDGSGRPLTVFGGYGSRPGQLQWPDAIHWDAAGRLYVADTGANRIQVWNESGVFLHEIGRHPRWRRALGPLLGMVAIALVLAAAGSAVGPFKLAAPAVNGRFVTMALSIGGAVCTLGWVLLTFVLFGGLHNPRDVLVGRDGLVYVSDFGADRVRVFSAQGDLIRSIGGGAESAGGLRRPLGLALWRDGRLYVADSGNHRVQVYEPDGKFVKTLGRRGRGPGEFDTPHGLTFDRDGFLHVADRGNRRLQTWTADGAPRGAIESPANAPESFVPAGICVNGDDALLIADIEGRRIVVQPTDVVRAARRRQ